MQSPRSSVTLGYFLLVCWLVSQNTTIFGQSRNLVDVTSQQFPAGLPKLTNGAQAWGDYDGDNLPDLIIMGKTLDGKNFTKLYHNTGSSFEDKSDLFKAPVLLPQLANGSLAWGDYDGDSRLDLMLSGESTNGPTSVLYHNTSDGFHYQAAWQPGTVVYGFAYSSVTWADFNADGRLDLFITGQQTVDFKNVPASTLMINTGTGFTDKSSWLPNLPQVKNASVVCADFNQDGRPDLLIIGDSQTNRVSKLYLSTVRDTYEKIFDIYEYEDATALLSNLPVVAGASLATGDYDQDGWPDLMLTGTSGNNFTSKLFHNAKGNFEEVAANLPDVKFSKVAWGDYDNDNRPDLMIIGQDTNGTPLSRLYHNTSRGFEDVSSALPALPQVSHGMIAWGDYDHDGWLDLIIAGDRGTGPDNYATVLYHNSKDGSFLPQPDALPGLTPSAYGAANWIDYNQDGRLDLFFSGIHKEVGGQTNTYAFYINKPDGFTNTILDTSPDLNIRSLINGFAEWADFNHDQLPDLMQAGDPRPCTMCNDFFSKQERVMMLQAGTVVYSDGKRFGVEDVTSKTYISNALPIRDGSMAWGDYDNDSWPDMIVTGNVGNLSARTILFHNNAGQNFTIDNGRLPKKIQLQHSSVAWGDYDNDGRLDLLITGQELPNGSLHSLLYHNIGNGFFEDKSSLLLNLAGLYHGSVAWIDYDHDGLLDFLVTGENAQGQAVTKLYRNKGLKVLFEETSSLLPNLPGLVNGTANWADYDKDGRVDLLLTGDTGSGYTTKLYHNTAGGFIDDSRFPDQLKLNLPQVALSAVAWADYDNDGFPDLLLTGKQEYGGPVSQLFHNQPLGAGATDSTRFRLVAPLYNCQSGAFTFQTTGGDGSPIEYMAPGITVWTSDAHQFVDRDTRTAADAQPITLVARQSGQEVRYVFDIRALCPVGDPNQFRLVAPLYDCQSGAFRFQTTGGNGSPIEYMAPGITAWTSNPQQYVDAGLRQAADAQPLILWARQHGQEDNYEWDIRAVCPVGSVDGKCSCHCCVGSSARVGAGEEPGVGLKAVVYPNPLVGEEVTVVLEGVQGQSVRLVVLDLRGHSVVDKPVTVEQPRQEERLNLGSTPGGMYLLRVSTVKESRTIKLIKTP